MLNVRPSVDEIIKQEEFLFTIDGYINSVNFFGR